MATPEQERQIDKQIIDRFKADPRFRDLPIAERNRVIDQVRADVYGLPSRKVASDMQVARQNVTGSGLSELFGASAATGSRILSSTFGSDRAPEDRNLAQRVIRWSPLSLIADAAESQILGGSTRSENGDPTAFELTRQAAEERAAEIEGVGGVVARNAARFGGAVLDPALAPVNLIGGGAAAAVARTGIAGRTAASVGRAAAEGVTSAKLLSTGAAGAAIEGAIGGAEAASEGRSAGEIASRAAVGAAAGAVGGALIEGATQIASKAIRRHVMQSPVSGKTYDVPELDMNQLAESVSQITRTQPIAMEGRGSIANAAVNVKRMADLAIRSASDQIREIDPAAATRLDRFNMNVFKRVRELELKVQPLTAGLDQIDVAPRREIGRLLSNQQFAEANAIISTLPQKQRDMIRKGLAEWQKVSPELLREAQEVGIKTSGIEAFFPRQVENPEALIRSMGGEGSKISAALREAAIRKSKREATKKLGSRAPQPDEPTGDFFGDRDFEAIQQAYNDAQVVSADDIASGDYRKVLTPEEQDAVIDGLLRGRVGPGEGTPGQFRQRTIRELDPDTYNRFYADSRQAISDYIQRTVRNIEMRRMVGAGRVTADTPELATEQAVSAIIGDGVRSGRVADADLDQLQYLVNGVLTPAGGNANWISAVTTMGHTTLLANPITAAIQFDDLAASAIVNGARNTLVDTGAEFLNIGRRLVGQRDKSRYGVIRDFGVERPSDEFANRGNFIRRIFENTMAFGGWFERTGRSITRNIKSERAFQLSSFTGVDRTTKNITLNAGYRQMRKVAQRADPQSTDFDSLVRNVRNMYPNDDAQVTQVLNDLRSGKRTPDTDYLVYSRLSGVQPLSAAELPPLYQGLNRAYPGAGRLAYFLQSFMVRRMSMLRREIFSDFTRARELAAAGDDRMAAKYAARAIGRGAKSMMLLGAFGVPVRAAQVWMVGKIAETFNPDQPRNDVDLMAMTEDTYLQTIGLSRYQLDAFADNKLWNSVTNISPLPFSATSATFRVLDDLWFDAQNTDNQPFDWNNLRSIRNVPVLGRPYDSIAGEGVQRAKRAFYRDNNKPKEDLDMILRGESGAVTPEQAVELYREWQNNQRKVFTADLDWARGQIRIGVPVEDVIDELTSRGYFKMSKDRIEKMRRGVYEPAKIDLESRFRNLVNNRKYRDNREFLDQMSQVFKALAAEQEKYQAETYQPE